MSFISRYAPWILAAALAAFVIFDPSSGIDVMPAINAVSGAVSGNLTLATFVERIFYVLVSLAVVVVILRFFDQHILGTPFSVWHDKIKANAQACAIYIGLRFVGICLLVGFVLSN